MKSSYLQTMEFLGSLHIFYVTSNNNYKNAFLSIDFGSKYLFGLKCILPLNGNVLLTVFYLIFQCIATQEWCVILVIEPSSE